MTWWQLLLLHTVPVVFMEQTMYRISEDNETVQVIVSTNGEHLLPVMFEIILTNDSAISKSSTNAIYVLTAVAYLAG